MDSSRCTRTDSVKHAAYTKMRPRQHHHHTALQHTDTVTGPVFTLLTHFLVTGVEGRKQPA